MSGARPVAPGTVDLKNKDNLDFMVRKSKVQKRRGSYWQLPKDLKDVEQ